MSIEGMNILIHKTSCYGWGGESWKSVMVILYVQGFFFNRVFLFIQTFCIVCNRYIVLMLQIILKMNTFTATFYKPNSCYMKGYGSLKCLTWGSISSSFVRLSNWKFCKHLPAGYQYFILHTQNQGMVSSSI